MIIRLRLAVALGLFSSTVGSLAAQRPALAALDDSLRTLLGPGAPGVAVGIVQQGAPVHRLYLGEADLSHHVPVGPATRFNIASLAKQFTAVTLLSLEESGRLSLDDDIRRWVPTLLPEVTTPITLRHLLTHTSGIRDVYDLWSLAGDTWWQRFYGNDDALALLNRQKQLNFAPGTDYLYSNSNYLLLAAAIAAAADSAFADVAAARFRSWGMPSTSFANDYLMVIPDRARPYGGGERWQEYPSVATLHGDGGLYTTLPDQLAWEALLQRPDASPLLRRSQLPLPDAATPDYGFGLEFGTYKGLPYRHHDGNTGAYNATVLRFPTRQLSVLVMSNNGTLDVRALALRYADAMLGEAVAAHPSYPAGPDVVGETVDITPWLGDYRASSGTLISLAQTDSGLVRRIAGASEVRLLPDRGNLFRYASNPALTLALQRDANGAPIFAIYLASQAPIVGRQLPPARPIAPDAWLGRYRNAETGAEVRIERISRDTVRAQLNGSSAPGRLPRTDLLQLRGYELQPMPERSGAISGLLLNGGRLARVRFTRVE